MTEPLPPAENQPAVAPGQNPFYATQMGAQRYSAPEPAPPYIAPGPSPGPPPPPDPSMPHLFADAGQRDSSTMAIVSLVLSVTGWAVCSLLGVGGIVCGIIALKETGRSGAKKGRGLAIAGIVTGVLGLLVPGAIFAWVYFGQQ